MTVDEMLRGLAGRASFHMPGHKSRLGAGSEWDTTELDNTDDLHQPAGPYLALAQRLARACGAAVSFPLVGGSTRGVQLMILSALQPGQTLLLPRSAHLSAWSACALGGIRAVSVPLRVDAEQQVAFLAAEDVKEAILRCPEARAILLTRPDYYGRLSDLGEVIALAHARGLAVLVDEAHGAHLRRLGLADAGALGADFWTQSLHKTLPALTPCAVLHARDASGAETVRRRHHMLESSSPSSLLLHSMEQCLDYMDAHGAQALQALRARCGALREELCADPRFAATRGFVRRWPADPTRLVIDVRGTGLTGYAAAEALRRRGVDVEMADSRRIVALPSVMSTEEDFARLREALCGLPLCGLPLGEGAQTTVCVSGLAAAGQPVCSVRRAALGRVRWVAPERAADCVAADSVGVYPPGVPLCVPGERVTPEAARALLTARRQGGTLFGVNEKGEMAVLKVQYDVVIFDLDGTLMDTSEGVTRSVRHALRAMGYPDDDAARIRRFIGPPLHEAFMREYGMSDGQAAEAVRLYRERYSAVGVMEYHPYDGMAQLVRDLHAAGVRVAVATGKPERFSRLILEREGLMDCIEMLVTPSLQDKGDTKPDMVRAVLERLGRNALMVGDRMYDMRGAAANGIDAAGVTQGFGSREELEGSGAAYIVHGAAQLRRLLLDEA